MQYIKKTVGRAPGNPGVGLKTRDQILLFDVDDILYMPSPDERGVVVVDNIVMKPGKYAYGIYMTPGTVELSSAADGDTDKVGFTPSVKFEHPGNEQEVREFKANSINRKFIVVVRYCTGKPADLIGSVCNPCKLTPSYTGSNESNTNEMTFAQIGKGDDILMYKGTFPLEEPVSVVPAGTTVDFVAEGQYQLSGGNAKIVTISGGCHEAVITLLGVAGTENPSVEPVEGKILLRNGEPFVGSEGSQLTLRAFNAGKDNLIWIEQSRFVVS